MNLTIRHADASEAEQIVGLIRATYPQRYLDLSVLGCTRAPRYVRDRIEVGIRDASTFTVAIDDDAMIGAAEFRRRPNGMFLNHVVVAPSHQGGGVGSDLLRFGVEALNLNSRDQVALDVFADNPVAIAWYKQLGLSIIDESALFCLDPKPDVPDMWRVDNLVQCGLLLHEYGFGSCRIVTDATDYSVGVLDTAVVKTKGIAGDDAALGALTHLWPESILLSEETDPPQTLEEYARTLRMNGGVLDLLDAVGGR